jgi:hypothetical protein
VAEGGRGGALTVHLINLHTGVAEDLKVRLGVPVGDLPLGGAKEQSMAWSPDSRWLFVAAADGRLVAINARLGRAEHLGVTLPGIDQVAIRA